VRRKNRSDHVCIVEDTVRRKKRSGYGCIVEDTRSLCMCEKESFILCKYCRGRCAKKESFRLCMNCRGKKVTTTVVLSKLSA